MAGGGILFQVVGYYARWWDTMPGGGDNFLTLEVASHGYLAVASLLCLLLDPWQACKNNIYYM